MKCAKKQLKDQHVGQQTTCECGSLKMHMHVMIWKKNQVSKIVSLYSA